MSNTRGITLVEMIVSLGITSIVLLSGFTVFVQMARTQSEVQSEISSQQDLALMSLHLGSLLRGGESRYYFFTGTAMTEMPELCTRCGSSGSKKIRPLSRMIVPLQNRCASLKKGCPKGVSLLMATSSHADKLNSSAMCLVPKGKKFQLITTQQSKLPPFLGISNPPISTIWIRKSKMTKVSQKEGQARLTYGDECINRLIKHNKGAYPKGKFYSAEVVPFVGRDTMGGKCVCEGHIDGALGELPARLHGVEIISMGPMTKDRWGIRRCRIGTLFEGLQCDVEISTIKNVEEVYVGERFSLQDYKRPNLIEISLMKYKSSECKRGECKSANLKLPYPYYSSGENPTKLNYDIFSMAQQEALKTLRLKFRFKDGKDDVQIFSF